MNKSAQSRPPLPDAEQYLERLLEQMKPVVGPGTGIIGIHTGGVWVAARLHAALGIDIPLGTLDVSFYRDDFEKIGLHRNVKTSDLPFDVDGRRLILVDDVLYARRASSSRRWSIVADASYRCARIFSVAKSRWRCRRAWSSYATARKNFPLSCMKIKPGNHVA